MSLINRPGGSRGGERSQQQPLQPRSTAPVGRISASNSVMNNSGGPNNHGNGHNPNNEPEGPDNDVQVVFQRPRMLVPASSSRRGGPPRQPQPSPSRPLQSSQLSSTQGPELGQGRSALLAGPGFQRPANGSPLGGSRELNGKMRLYWAAADPKKRKAAMDRKSLEQAGRINSQPNGNSAMIQPNTQSNIPRIPNQTSFQTNGHQPQPQQLSQRTRSTATFPQPSPSPPNCTPQQQQIQIRSIGNINNPTANVALPSQLNTQPQQALLQQSSASSSRLSSISQPSTSQSVSTAAIQNSFYGLQSTSSASTSSPLKRVTQQEPQKQTNKQNSQTPKQTSSSATFSNVTRVTPSSKRSLEQPPPGNVKYVSTSSDSALKVKIKVLRPEELFANSAALSPSNVATTPEVSSPNVQRTKTPSTSRFLSPPAPTQSPQLAQTPSSVAASANSTLPSPSPTLSKLPFRSSRPSPRPSSPQVASTSRGFSAGPSTSSAIFDNAEEVEVPEENAPQSVARCCGICPEEKVGDIVTVVCNRCNTATCSVPGEILNPEARLEYNGRFEKKFETDEYYITLTVDYIEPSTAETLGASRATSQESPEKQAAKTTEASSKRKNTKNSPKKSKRQKKNW